MKQTPEQIERLSVKFRIEELQERLEYKVTRPGREDWYDPVITVSGTDTQTGVTTTVTVSGDW